MESLPSKRPDRPRSEPPPLTLSVASLLCALPGVYGVVAPYVQLLPQHAFDKNWTPHQRFHVTWAAAKLTAFGMNQILLALIPSQRRERWSWFALASNFVFGGLSIPLASRLQVGPLRPLETHDRATRLAFAAMVSTLLGLLLAIAALAGPDRRR